MEDRRNSDRIKVKGRENIRFSGKIEGGRDLTGRNGSHFVQMFPRLPTVRPAMQMTGEEIALLFQTRNWTIVGIKNK